MRLLEHRIPPPIVAAAAAFAMWELARSSQSIDMGATVRNGLMLLTLIAGLAFTLGGIVSFRRANTTVNPLKPRQATALVTSGVYRLSRNPMYVGMLWLLLAWGFYLGSPLAFLPIPLFIWYISRYQITPEERALLDLFGTEFQAYRARVRRWL
ncbi:MAG: isoprenylcysteine carboxylmethyltransferase family protein [Pseudomonadota bacterium]